MDFFVENNVSFRFVQWFNCQCRKSKAIINLLKLIELVVQKFGSQLKNLYEQNSCLVMSFYTCVVHFVAFANYELYFSHLIATPNVTLLAHIMLIK